MNCRVTTSGLQEKAREVRRDIIEMCYRAGSGHGGGSLSCVEILLALYNWVLNVRADEPGWPQRDRLVLSKGHAAPALYAVLASKRYFPKEWLYSLRRFGSRLRGHIPNSRTFTVSALPGFPPPCAIFF